MSSNIRFQLVTLGTILALVGCQSPSLKVEREEDGFRFIHQWMRLTREKVTAEFISPPETSRILAYLSIAMHESALHNGNDSLSLSSEVNGGLTLPNSPGLSRVDPITALTECAYLVLDEALKRHLSSYDTSLKYLHKQQLKLRKPLFDKPMTDRSIEYGREVAENIIEWMRDDGYDSTRTYAFFQAPSRLNNPAGWEPTEFGQVPMEPFWKELRPFLIQNKVTCDIGEPLAFSTDSSSAFYMAASELVNIDKNITPEQMEIALFWADCPGDTPTPPGHWNAIVDNVVPTLNLSLSEATKTYAVVGMGVADAFILCWKKKYEINLVRPKTYIQEFIGPEDWEPFVETPPFPEFTAGHSVMSNTAAGLLTSLLGDSIKFTDDFHETIGLSARTFNSFYDAASEASMSRVYGGIHYRFTVEQSEEQAKCIVEQIATKLKLEQL